MWGQLSHYTRMGRMQALPLALLIINNDDQALVLRDLARKNGSVITSVQGCKLKLISIFHLLLIDGISATMCLPMQFRSKQLAYTSLLNDGAVWMKREAVSKDKVKPIRLDKQFLNCMPTYSFHFRSLWNYEKFSRKPFKIFNQVGSSLIQGFFF